MIVPGPVRAVQARARPDRTPDPPPPPDLSPHRALLLRDSSPERGWAIPLGLFGELGRLVGTPECRGTRPGSGLFSCWSSSRGGWWWWWENLVVVVVVVVRFRPVLLGYGAGPPGRPFAHQPVSCPRSRTPRRHSAPPRSPVRLPFRRRRRLRLCVVVFARATVSVRENRRETKSARTKR